MRTLEPHPIYWFTPIIDLLIWVKADTEYTFWELQMALRPFWEKCWRNPNGYDCIPQAEFQTKTGSLYYVDYGPEIVREDGAKCYRIFYRVPPIPENRLHAFGNFVVVANQRLRNQPPPGCLEIFTKVRFEADLGPEQYEAKNE